MSFAFSNISDIFDENKLSFSYRIEKVELWEEVYEKLNSSTVSYSQTEIEYQLAYQKQNYSEILDISIIIKNDDIAVGIWPLTLMRCSEENHINSYGIPIIPPLFLASVSLKTQKKLMRKCFDAIRSICEEYKINEWKSSSLVSTADDCSISIWHRLLADYSIKIFVTHNLFVNLGLDIKDIKAHFRKSYKPLINKGKKIWKVNVLEMGCDNTWKEFKELHKSVAGRVTRSDETWELNFKAIIEKKSILIYLRDTQNKMVGGGYFSYSKNECRYDVAAYDRTLFDSPLGHVVQYEAIEFFKEKKIQWYKIGRRYYSSDMENPSEKEISISKFKEGFATHIFPEFFFHITEQ